METDCNRRLELIRQIAVVGSWSYEGRGCDDILALIDADDLDTWLDSKSETGPLKGVVAGDNFLAWDKKKKRFMIREYDTELDKDVLLEIKE